VISSPIEIFLLAKKTIDLEPSKSTITDAQLGFDKLNNYITSHE
jgi:hypothetical protein